MQTISEDYSTAVNRLGRVGSFAPGNYLCLCIKCGITFDGDKRALNCLPCAVGFLKTVAAGVKLPVTEDAGTGDSQDAASAGPLGSPQIPTSDAQSVRPDGGEA